VLDTPGWWRRADRFSVRPLWTESTSSPVPATQPVSGEPTRAQPLLIAGATGTLGSAFARICDERGLTYRLLSRQDLDITDISSVAGLLDEAQPWAVINAAGYVRVDEAEREQARCMRENADGPAVLAVACASQGVRLVTFSSDLVFDGSKDSAYVESDSVAPLNVYGRSKVLAEQRVLAGNPDALVVRTSAFFGPWDTHNFVYAALRALAAGEAFSVANDTLISPTYVPDLVHTALDLLIDGESGIWHLANAGAVSWLELAARAAQLAGVERTKLRPRPTSDLGLAAARPRASALESERGWLMPTLDDALARFVLEADTRC
jgi:dTDP-4-dehydrorhamnose reductase